MARAAHASQDLPTTGEEGARTLSSELTGRLRQAILSGELAPGSKLKLEVLRERLGLTLSRSPLREALSRLGAEGLVRIEDQRGYRVAPVSEANLREIARLRIHLETLALRESIRLGDAQWERSIDQALGDLADAPRTESSRQAPDAWEAAHRRFHFALLGACDMPLLLQYCARVHDQNDRYRRLFLQRHPFDRDVHREHQAIVEATLERNADLACALLAQHIDRTTRNICAALG